MRPTPAPRQQGHPCDPFPDFFLVGAPRCGTSALAKYLKLHPQVCFSRPKEPHFFSALGASTDAADLQRDYADRFFSHYSPAEHRAVGEGSVSYLYSEAALERILALNPSAKFVAMVRNPVQMVASFHALLCFYMEEDVEDLGAAWRLQEERAKGRRLPERCLDPRLLQYADVGSLGRYVEQLFQIAGRERCKVLVYDDLAADPRSVYLEALRFLGLDDDGRSSFQLKKPSRRFKSRRLQRLIYWHPRRFERLAAYVQERSRRHKSTLKRLRQRLVRMNTIPGGLHIDPGLREELSSTFTPDVARLGGLIGRDLSGWR